jgi:arylsulfatase A-like enzyme
VYEGGHREPFIVRWPGVVKPGSVCHHYVQQADVMATLAEIWGVKLPDSAGEDSFSFVSLLKGNDQPVRAQGVNTACNGVPSIRQGSWKLVLAADENTGDQVQLFNLESDLAESTNLARQQVERVAQMRALLEKLIIDGRSTPGAAQKNDVRVRRYPLAAAIGKAKAKKAKAK